jgi:hypothetical protein
MAISKILEQAQVKNKQGQKKKQRKNKKMQDTTKDQAIGMSDSELSNDQSQL